MRFVLSVRLQFPLRLVPLHDCLPVHAGAGNEWRAAAGFRRWANPTTANLIPRAYFRQVLRLSRQAIFPRRTSRQGHMALRCGLPLDVGTVRCPLGSVLFDLPLPEAMSTGRPSCLVQGVVAEIQRPPTPLIIPFNEVQVAALGKDAMHGTSVESQTLRKLRRR